MEKRLKQLLLRIKQTFAEGIDSIRENTAQETVIVVEKSQLPAICRFLAKEKKGRLFTMTGTDERKIFGSFFLSYVFSFDEFHHLITVKTRVEEEDPTFPSVTPELPAANWYEREVRELLGLRPQGHPDPRPLVLHGEWPEDLYPLRKDFPANTQVPREKDRDSFMQYVGEGITEVPVGPIHAGIIEPGHFRFGVIGDTILHLDAKLFYTHRGLEKVSEGMPLGKALFLAERTCGVCALSHGAAFAQAVERMAEVEIPVRAKYLRTLFLELERLYNHIGDVGNVCAGFGFAFGISQGARLREELLQLNERLSGHRYLRGIIELGGTRIDLGDEDLSDLIATLQKVEEEFKDMVEILLSHEVALQRMATTGQLSRIHADQLEVVGPAARASGRDMDCRRDLPYAAYDQVTFRVPVFQEGDVLSRVRMRIEEAFQSFSIIYQVIDHLPDGGIATEIPPIPPYRSAMGWSESPRGENVHWLMIGPNQTVYRYRIRSAAYSNWPAVPLAVQGNIVPDFPLINKSFELCYACCDR